MSNVVEFTRRVVGEDVQFDAHECTRCGEQAFELRVPNKGAFQEMAVAVCRRCGASIADTVFVSVVAEGIHDLYEEGLNGEG